MGYVQNNVKSGQSKKKNPTNIYHDTKIKTTGV